MYNCYFTLCDDHPLRPVCRGINRNTIVTATTDPNWSNLCQVPLILLLLQAMI